MKRYEKIALLKNKIRDAERRLNYYSNRVPKFEKNLEHLKEYHKEIEMVSIKEIEKYRKNQAFFFEEVKARKQELRTFGSKPKPKPKAKALPKEKETNGKILCDICKKEYSKQGFPSHYKKCLRIKHLEEEIARELEDPPIEEEPIVEIPIPEEKPLVEDPSIEGEE